MELMNEVPKTVVVISPCKLRHRLFISRLALHKIEIGGIIKDTSNSRSIFRSFFSLSRFLDFALSLFEFLVLGRLKIIDLPIFKIDTLSDNNLPALINRLRPTVIIVYGGKIIPSATLGKILTPIINVHGSLLPGYRGLDSYWWALLERRNTFQGYSIHFVDSGIDTGNLLFTKPYSGQTHSFYKHLNWRIWTAIESAQSVYSLLNSGNLQTLGVVHKKDESLYRSSISIMSIARHLFRIIMKRIKA